MKSRYASDLAPEEVFNEANRILAQDRARLGNLNAPIYKGQTISPMSTLTQRARGLQSGFNAKGAPYSNKIASVLSRPNQVNPLGLQGQVELLGRGQEGFNKNILSRILGEQYRGGYNPNANKGFLAKTAKDLPRGLNETAASLGDIGRSANILEQSSNQALAQRLQGLQGQKQDRRKALVGMLEQFGNQKHAYNNLVNTANKNAFEQESMTPAKRMELLQASLNPLSQNMGENVLPEIKAQAAKEALQALKAYGIDTNKPVNEWENARTGTPSYPGKLIADLPPEILASHNTLEEVSPKFRGSGYDQAKNIIREMMTNPNVGDRALGNVPGRMQPQVENLESAAQKRLKQDLAAINNQFIQANQFGSPLHLKTAEDRAREISKATLEQRGKLLEDTSRSELALGHQQQQSNLRQLGVLGDEAQKEYQNMLNAIRSTNNVGATKFANEQAENEDLYKNFQNEAGWEWPHLRGSIAKDARAGAIEDIFGGMARRGLNVDQLTNQVADYNTRFSENQREAQNKQITDLQGQLKTGHATIADLQRQLGLQNQAEAQRKAQEQQRLAQQQQAQETAKKAEAAKSAEAQRLAAIQAETERNSIPQYYRKEFLTPALLAAAKRESNFNQRGLINPNSTDEQAINLMRKYGFVPVSHKGNGTIDWGNPRRSGVPYNQAQTNDRMRWNRLDYKNGQWIPGSFTLHDMVYDPLKYESI